MSYKYYIVSIMAHNRCSFSTRLIIIWYSHSRAESHNIHIHNISVNALACARARVRIILHVHTQLTRLRTGLTVSAGDPLRDATLHARAAKAIARAHLLGRTARQFVFVCVCCVCLSVIRAFRTFNKCVCVCGMTRSATL